MIDRDRLGIRMTLSGVGFSGSGCGDLTWTKLNAERIRQSETCAVPDFAMGDSRGFAVQRPRGTSEKATAQCVRGNSCLDEGTRWLRDGSYVGKYCCTVGVIMRLVVSGLE